MKPPNLIIGPCKCGTTTLARTLDKHPEISLVHKADGTAIKEFQWYDHKDDEGVHWPEAKYRLDGAPQYLDRWKIDERLGSVAAEGSKVIMLTRHPVERFLSHWHQLSTGLFKDDPAFQKTLEEVLTLLEEGTNRYRNMQHCSDFWPLFQKLTQYFNPEDVLVMPLEILRGSHEAICDFLGIAYIEMPKLHQFKAEGKPEFSDEVRQRVLNLFPDNAWAVEQLGLPEHYLTLHGEKE